MLHPCSNFPESAVVFLKRHVESKGGNRRFGNLELEECRVLEGLVVPAVPQSVLLVWDLGQSPYMVVSRNRTLSRAETSLRDS